MVNNEHDDTMLLLASRPNAKMKVWGHVKSNMSAWNDFVAEQTIMAEELGITRQYVGKALKFLESKNLIVRNGKKQANVIFMVNPEYCWNGAKSDIDNAKGKYKSIKEA